MLKGLCFFSESVFKRSSAALRPCMPRQAQVQSTAALEGERSALERSLKAVTARIRQERKRVWAREQRELSAARRRLQQAVTILVVHDSARSWLPAFMRKHGMSGVGEELEAFDQEVCNSFLGLSVDDVNAIRDPPDQQGRTRLREALAFITEQQLHAWVADQNERQGIAPTVGDTLKRRDELAAAHSEEMGRPPLWSVDASARYKWSRSFRRRWRLGLRKPHAREAVPLETARQKAKPLRYREQTPSHFSPGRGLAFIPFWILYKACLPLSPYNKAKRPTSIRSLVAAHPIRVQLIAPCRFTSPPTAHGIRGVT